MGSLSVLVLRIRIPLTPGIQIGRSNLLVPRARDRQSLEGKMLAKYAPAFLGTCHSSGSTSSVTKSLCVWERKLRDTRWEQLPS